MNLEAEIQWFLTGNSNCGKRTEDLVKALIDDRQKLINNLTAKGKLIEAYEDQALEDGHE